MVKDENNKPLLSLDFCAPGVAGGYQPLRVFGKLDSDYVDDDVGPYEGRTAPEFIAGDARQSQQRINLAFDEKLAEKFYALYDEQEYRVYIPRRQDFFFEMGDLASIALPNAVSITGGDGVFFDVESFCKDAKDNKVDLKEAAEKTEKDFIVAFGEYIHVRSNIGVDDVADRISPATFRALRFLFKLLDDCKNDDDFAVQCKKVVSLPKKTVETAEKAKRLSGTVDRAVDQNAGVKYLRKLVKAEEIYPKLKKGGEVVAKEIGWKNHTHSIVAALNKDPAGGSAPKGEAESAYRARVGAEAIVIGRDKEDNAYALFVDNSKKQGKSNHNRGVTANNNTGFFELIGGGFLGMPTSFDANGDASSAAYRELIKHKLSFKGALTDKDLTGLSPTEYALIVDDAAVMKDKSIG